MAARSTRRRKSFPIYDIWICFCGTFLAKSIVARFAAVYNYSPFVRRLARSTLRLIQLSV